MQSTITPVALLLDLVPSALAGIDLLSFTVTPKFRGIKDLPKGWHFVFTGTSSGLSIRQGLWFCVDRQKLPPFLFISRWQATSETYTIERDEAEILRWRANLGEFWPGLAPYRQSGRENDDLNDWPALTSNISEGLLNRILHGNQWALTSASSALQDRDEIAGINEGDFDSAGIEELQFLPIDLKKTWRDGATGRERTNSAIDRSWALNDLVQRFTSSKLSDEVIGELQFCFLMTLTLNNWSCFEQWKRILSLVFTCRTAVQRQPDFFIRFIAAVRMQCQHNKDAEGGLIDMTDDGGSLLRSLLVRFRTGQESISLDNQDVLDELDDLEAYLRDEYGWQFSGSFVRSGLLELDDGEQVTMDTTAFDEDDETGEYAPAVVELSAEQMRILQLDEPDMLASLQSTGLDEDGQRDLASTSSSLEEDQEETAELEQLDERY